MSKNKPLEAVVLQELSKWLLANDPSFRLLTDGEEEVGKSVVKGMGELNIDEPHKVRFHFSPIIGYGYDFSKEYGGESAKDIYQRAVENTKELSGSPMMETFVSDGVQDNFGWYITRFR